MSRDQAPIIPSQYNVIFRGRRCADRADSVGYLLSYTSTPDNVAPTDQNAPQSITPQPHTIKTFRDSAVALFDTGVSSSNPTNKTALDKLAKKIAQDWLDWQVADDPGDTLISGIIAPTPCGLIHCIEFAYDRDECYTRVQSPPLNAAPDELCHWDPATAACNDQNNPRQSGTPVAKVPGVEVYGPPESCSGGGGMAYVSSVDGDGAVTGITVTKTGTYSTAPTVCFSEAGGGSGATATATLTAGKLPATISPSVGGQGYSVGDPVSFDGGGTKYQKTRFRLFVEAGRVVGKFVSYDTIGA